MYSPGHGIDLYLLNDALTAMCYENGLEPSDDELNELTHSVAALLDELPKREELTVPE